MFRNTDRTDAYILNYKNLNNSYRPAGGYAYNTALYDFQINSKAIRDRKIDTIKSAYNEQGALLCNISSDKNNLLHVAAEEQKEDKDLITIVELLLDAGCDPNEKNIFYKTAFDLAVMNGHIHMLTLFIKKIPLQSLRKKAYEDVSNAIKYNQVGVVKLLLTHIDIPLHGNDLLNLAIYNYYRGDIVLLLIDAGVKLNKSFFKKLLKIEMKYYFPNIYHIKSGQYDVDLLFWLLSRRELQLHQCQILSKSLRPILSHTACRDFYPAFLRDTACNYIYSDFYNIKYYGSFSIQNFKSALDLLSDVKILNFSNIRMSQENYNELFSFLKDNAATLSLKILNLSTTAMSPESITDLVKFLEQYPHLEELYLNDNSLGGKQQLQNLIRFLQIYSSLHTLELNNVNLNLNDVAMLVDMLDSKEGFYNLSFKDKNLDAKDLLVLKSANFNAQKRAYYLGYPLSRWIHQQSSKISDTPKLELNSSVVLRRPQISEMEYLQEIYQKLLIHCEYIDSICDYFIPFSETIKNNIKKNNIRLSDLEAWQLGAPILQEKIRAIREDILSLNIANYTYQDCLVRHQTIENLFIAYIGKGWLMNKPDTNPLVAFYINLLIYKNELNQQVFVQLKNQFRIPATAREHFYSGIHQGLENYYLAAAVLESGLVLSNNMLTPEEYQQHQIEGVIEKLMDFSTGVVAFTCLGIAIPALKSSLAALGISSKALHLLQEGAEVIHLLHLIPNCSEKMAHFIVSLLHRHNKQHSLPTHILRRCFRMAFKDQDDFNDFKNHCAAYFAQRYQYQAEIFEPQVAYSFGTSLSERIVEPFMLGLKPWANKLTFKETLDKVSVWVYYAATFPFLMKRRENLPIFTTISNEKVSLDAVLSPAGFWCLNKNEQKVYIEVEPLERKFQSAALNKHRGEENKSIIKSEKTTPRLTSYVMATESEVAQLEYQLHVSEKQEAKLDEYIRNQFLIKSGKILKALSVHDSKNKIYEDVLKEIEALCPKNLDNSSANNLPFVIKLAGLRRVTAGTLVANPSLLDEKKSSLEEKVIQLQIQNDIQNEIIHSQRNQIDSLTSESSIHINSLSSPFSQLNSTVNFDKTTTEKISSSHLPTQPTRMTLEKFISSRLPVMNTIPDSQLDDEADLYADAYIQKRNNTLSTPLLSTNSNSLFASSSKLVSNEHSAKPTTQKKTSSSNHNLNVTTPVNNTMASLSLFNSTPLSTSTGNRSNTLSMSGVAASNKMINIYEGLGINENGFSKSKAS